MIDRQNIDHTYKKWANASKENLPHQEIINLTYLIGEAIIKIQILEDAISHSLSIKKDAPEPDSITRAEAKKIVERYRRKYTLGDAIKLAGKENIYSKALLKDLQNFSLERNWLVHRCMAENMDDIESGFSGRNNLFYRIKRIGIWANQLQRAVEIDLENFCFSKGMNIKKMYTEAYNTLKDKQV